MVSLDVKVPKAKVGSRDGSPLVNGAIIGLFLIATSHALYTARSLLLPVVLAVLLKVLLAPVMRWLRRLGLADAISASLILCLVLGGLAVQTVYLADPAREWIEASPRMMDRLYHKLRDWRRPLDQVNRASKVVESLASTDTDDGVPVVTVRDDPTILDVVMAGARASFGGLLIAFMLLFLLLASGDQFLRKLVQLTPSLGQQRRLVQVVRNVESDLSRYLFARTLLNIALGVVVAIALHLAGLPNPALWGITAALLNFIPYLGAIITAFLLFASAVTTYDSAGSALIVTLVFLVITSIEGNLITPLVLGRHMTLNSVAVFLCLLFWGWVWGIPGTILAVPITSSLKVVFEQFERTRPIAVFLSR